MHYASLLLSFFLLFTSLEGKMIDEYKAKNFYHLVGMSGFSEHLLKLHFDLYEGYVRTTNQLLHAMEDAPLGSLNWAGLQRQLAFEFNGMRLHELYFENLGGKAPLQFESKLFKQIHRDFGSFDKWKSAFIATALMRGIGWAVLYLDKNTNTLLNGRIEEHQINGLCENALILVLDVWEHAYLTEYQTNRAEYIEAFMKNIDWSVVNHRFEEALK